MAMAMAMKLRFLPSYEHRFMSTPPPSSKPWCFSPTKLMIKIKSQTQSLQFKASSKKNRRPENVDGEFFVDHTCIDCDTCRWMAPYEGGKEMGASLSASSMEVFTRVDGMSVVSKQPSCQDEHLKALQALLSCPTSSIHTEKPAHNILEVQKTFPIPIDVERIPGVYHCGYHSEKSYGAASYLIVHPEGNILIDSPRYTERLACNIENMGGARYMFLTHRDDVADHQKWSERLSCERILHSTEVEASTNNVETKLNGCGPWSLNDDIQIIHTPGHTEVLSQQLDSVAMLLELEFEWMIPGHGRKAVYKDVEEKNSSIKAFLAAKQHTGYF
ncbi:hypothetical protein Ccrd_024651 [Cynara cardunculus var. scolymus]|uniref:Metallo-beta-lactamase domain-containing protein n=1 Tax=Cynara cardunculus var. scolymus TaxID=59895 RepID=A0A118JRR2_CYNCS|nr:hypothetical protein Ccrd_024651 [Cynara cardunculus var. scolymus]